MEKQNLTIPVAIIIAGALIAGGVFLSNKNSNSTNENKKTTKEIIINPVTEKDHIMGNPNANIVLVEFSDTECPFCKRFHGTMNQIMEKYGKSGEVAWVYRHFPLDKLHKKARKEAEATECAAELGGNEGFWNFTNKLYEKTPSNDGFDLSKLPDLAESVGLDKTAFEECLASERHSATVESQLQDGIKAGAKGTPYNVLILNKKDKIAISGAMPYPVMDTIMGMAINGKDADVISQFVNLISSRASDYAIQEFLEKNYPEKSTE